MKRRFQPAAWPVLTLALAAVAAGLQAAPALVSVLEYSLAMLVFLPEMLRYRGLSGVGCALVVGLAAAALGEARAEGRRGLALAFGVVLAACGLKVIFEMTTGAAVFVDTASAGFVAVPLAHLVGGVWGWLVGPANDV